MQKIGNSRLKSKNMTKAINTRAVPLLTYSFGFINWSAAKIKDIETKIKKC